MRGWTSLTKEQRDLMVRLKSYKAHGARIFINGWEASENEWDKIFMLRDHAPDGSSQFYVMDYVTDEKGNIKEVRIDRIKLKDI